MTGRFTAPGKIILFGEHAVVYGKPAIAIPVSGMRASAWSETSEEGLTINAIDLGKQFNLKNKNNQFSVLAQSLLAKNNQNEPNLTFNLSSKSATEAVDSSKEENLVSKLSKLYLDVRSVVKSVNAVPISPV